MNISENFERNAFSPERRMPNIEGFEASNLDGEQVEGLIRNLIPEEHLNKCERISCAPDSHLWEVYHDALGLFNTGTRDIYLAGGERFAETGENEIEVLFHEIGHNAHYELMDGNPRAAAEWEQLHQKSLVEYDLTGFGFVSDYASTDAEEDFAETYSQYIANPELVEFMTPEKYEFMKSIVFVGREYGSLGMENGQSILMEKSVANIMNSAKELEIESDDGIIQVSRESNPISDTYRCFSMVA